MLDMVRKKPIRLVEQIEKILQEKPNREAVLKEITLKGTLIKSVGGNIDLVRHLSTDIVAKIWKTQKINELIRSSSALLRKNGINPSIVRRQRFRYLKQLRDDLQEVSSSPLDSVVPQRSLEVVVELEKKKEAN